MRIQPSSLTLEKLKSYLPEPGLFDQVPMDDPHLKPTFFEDAVRNGAELYHLVEKDTGKIILITCFQWDDQRDEFELLATQSYDSKFSVTKDALPVAEQTAMIQGAKSMRIATLRPGLIKLCVESGYRIAEVILRKDLTPKNND